MNNLSENQFKVQTYRTEHPQGKNSVYTRLPGDRWMREKTATGETHVQDEVRFVHPDYAGGVNWANMEGGDHLLKGGVVNHVTVNDKVPKGHPDRLNTSPVPDTHVSREPKEGWTPVEWSHERDAQGRKQLTSRHVGHPVAPLQRGDYK
jgi:hypothetical protein